MPDHTPLAAKMYEAVKYALDRQQTDADFGYVAGWGTETFYHLIRAEAEYLGEPVADVERRRRVQSWRYEPRVTELRRRVEELEALNA